MQQVVKYFKLGDHAHSFYSPLSGLKVVKNQVVCIEAIRVRDDPKVRSARTGGHLIEVTEQEYKSCEEPYRKDLCNERVSDTLLASPPAVAPEDDDEEDDDEDDDDEDDDDDKKAPPKKTVPNSNFKRK